MSTVRHLRPSRASAPAGPSANELAIRVALTQTVGAMVAHEPTWASSDGERLALLAERVGDVAAAFNHAHTDIDGAVLKVCVTALAWAEARAREAAR